MAVTAREGRKQTQQIITTTPRRRVNRNRKRTPTKIAPKPQRRGSQVTSSLKASVVGGVVILFLLLVSLIPAWYLAFLVVPGFLVAWLSTGLLAGVLAGDSIKNTQQGGKVGWMAGFWAGVFGGLVAMILAASGVIMVSFGQGVVDQFGPEQIESFAGYGLGPNVIAIMGRVFGALIVYGVIGSLISGLFSSIGGMIYPKLAISSNPPEKGYRTSA